jgi:hypothetical protein
LIGVTTIPTDSTCIVFVVVIREIAVPRVAEKADDGVWISRLDESDEDGNEASEDA